MRLKLALVGLIALGSATLTMGFASAMPIVPFLQSPSSGVENVALVCGPRGCIRTAPIYGYGGYGVRRYGYGYGVRRGGYGVRRGYAYRRGFRR
jgi:hypothetical protein